MNCYYVYQLRREDRELPFYVGKGGAEGYRRPYDHMHIDSNYYVNEHKRNTINKAIREGKYIFVEFLKMHLSEDDVDLWEVFYIAEYGRKDLGYGPLVNKTDGGEGTSGIIVGEDTRDKLSEAHRDTVEEFIEKAIAVHGNKYDYSKVDIGRRGKKVSIVCNRCSKVFEQSRSNHLTGFGCKYCAGNIPISMETFLSESKRIHGDSYSYEDVKYGKISDLVQINCKRHGPILQNAGSHMTGILPMCCYRDKMKRCPWLNGSIQNNSDAVSSWADADVIYELWLKYGNPGGIRMNGLVADGVNRKTTYDTMIRKFRNGWVPTEDIEWKDFSEEYRKCN